jgi:hypothetical protein
LQVLEASGGGLRRRLDCGRFCRRTKKIMNPIELLAVIELLVLEITKQLSLERFE